MDSLKEFLSLGFIQYALVAGVAVAVASAMVGSFVILRNLSFIGAGIAHSSFAGVVIGLLININPLLSALVFSVATGMAIAVFSRRYNINEDSAVGVFFPFTMALGVILLGFIKGYTPNVMGYLFGDVLLVSRADVLISLFALAFVVLFIFLFFKELVYITFDEESARVAGVKVDFMNYAFLTLIALVVVISIKIVGIILLSGLMVIPPLIALQFSGSMKSYIGLSVAVGFFSVIGGLYISFVLDIPSGATIVVLQFLLLVLSFLIARIFITSG